MKKLNQRTMQATRYFLIALLLTGCQQLDNLNTERQMYQSELLNGLPTRHGHLADGSPYEEWNKWNSRAKPVYFGWTTDWENPENRLSKNGDIAEEIRLNFTGRIKQVVNIRRPKAGNGAESSRPRDAENKGAAHKTPAPRHPVRARLRGRPAVGRRRSRDVCVWEGLKR
jgi:hypothetical protein